MLKIVRFFVVFCLASTAIASTATPADMFIPIYFSTSKNLGKPAGTIHVSQTNYGLLLTPDLHGLAPGLHGFDIHENPSCANHGLAAGGDLDPSHTNQHLGPYNPNGHLGDLPMLYVSSDGKANFPVFAPRILNINDIKNHAFIIQANGKDDGTIRNNRVACGVIASSDEPLNNAHTLNYRLKRYHS